MKTYCAAAFRQIYSDNAGRYRLCCHANDNIYTQHYNTRNTMPFDYFLSNEMELIREKMLSGEPISGCETCYKLEERGHPSWRTWKYNSIFPLTTDVEKVQLKLRVLGSYCNLACYMCYPYNSSTRRVELKQNDIHWEDYDGEAVNISTRRYDEVVNDILNNIRLVDCIHITGGEPLQLPRMWQFVERIPDQYAKEITLIFDTNLTQLEFKQWNIWQLVSKFKQVSLGVSCDHFGDKLAWIRYPIDVQKFEANLQTAKSIISNINVTVSMLNIDKLDEICDYYSDFNVTFTGIVCNPTMLSVRNLPEHLKQRYKEKYKQYANVVQELDQPIIEGDLQRGIDYCRKLNSRRNINFDLLFDEFFHSIQ